MLAFPSSWASNFGNNYYRHAQARELATIDQDGLWDVTVEGQPYNDAPELNVTSAEVVASSIEQIISDMKERGASDGDRI